MILWKMWFDLRVRFFFSLAFSIVCVMLLVVIFPLTGPLLSYAKGDIAPEEWSKIRPILSDYRLFMDLGWFRDVQYVSLFAVIFALGGVLTEHKSRSIYFTLSLPVRRRQWILYHSGMALVLITVLCTIASVLILIGGVVYAKSYPLWLAMQGALFLSLVTVPWIGITFAVTSLTQDRMKTALVIFAIWCVNRVLERIPPIRLWLPRHLLDYLGGSAFPWQSLLLIFALGIGGILFAIRNFEEQDY